MAMSTIESEPVVDPEPVVSEPVESAVGEPGIESAETVPADAPASEAPDHWAEYGGKDAVEAAVKLHKAAQTEEGVTQLFFEAGRALGLGVKELQTLFGVEPEPEVEEPDPEAPLTRAEAQKLFEEQQVQYRRSQSQDAALANAKNTVATALNAAGIDPASDTAAIVLQLGNPHLRPEDSLNPAAIKAAVDRGVADYHAEIEKEAKAYLERKAKAGDSVPGSPSGSGAASVGDLPEPKSVQEAIQMIRKKRLQNA